MRKHKLKGRTYISSEEEIKVDDWITDGYFVWQWKDNSSLLGRRKIIFTDNPNLESVDKLSEEEVREIWNFDKYFPQK